jgi:hypothetical protein
MVNPQFCLDFLEADQSVPRGFITEATYGLYLDRLSSKVSLLNLQTMPLCRCMHKLKIQLQLECEKLSIFE